MTHQEAVAHNLKLRYDRAVVKCRATRALWKASGTEHDSQEWKDYLAAHAARMAAATAFDAAYDEAGKPAWEHGYVY